MTKAEAIRNACKLSVGPILPHDDCDERYYIGYAEGRIAIFEKNEGIPPRIIAYFQPTEDGRIAANRYANSLNGGENYAEETLSFEKESNC